jgi:hypothetical protein
VDEKVKKEKSSTVNKRVVRVLTSSMEGVDELPVKRLVSFPSSILALFGEGARGLPTGVRCPMSRCGGEVSSAARRVSERTKVCDVLMGAVTLTMGSSSSPLCTKCIMRTFKKQYIE